MRIYKEGKPDMEHREKKNRKKRKGENAEMGNSLPAGTDGNFLKARERKKNKTRSDDITNKVDAKVPGLSNVKGRVLHLDISIIFILEVFKITCVTAKANETGLANGGNNSFKRKNKREIGKRVKSLIDETDTPNINAIEGRVCGKKANGGNNSCKRKYRRGIGKRVKSVIDEPDAANGNDIEGRISGKKDDANEVKDKLQKPRQKERKSIECVKRADAFNEADDAFERQNDEEMALTTKLESEDHDQNSVGLDGADISSFKYSGKTKMSAKRKKKRRLLDKESSQNDFLENKGNVVDDGVDQMSSGDEDYSKGMKKWVMQYHQSRPGIKVLQQRIDHFITVHEAQEEQAREEREAQAEEGGWTVVVHHKGRKKTTDAESGTVVGSVAQAAVLDKMAKKKSKEVGLDFYRFQRREAHRNEIMMLQSKFEQDKKRIQEMRAARKFRPY